MFSQCAKHATLRGDTPSLPLLFAPLTGRSGLGLPLLFAPLTGRSGLGLPLACAPLSLVRRRLRGRRG